MTIWLVLAVEFRKEVTPRGSDQRAVFVHPAECPVNVAIVAQGRLHQRHQGSVPKHIEPGHRIDALRLEGCAGRGRRQLRGMGERIEERGVR
jgi:hypothetical protein